MVFIEGYSNFVGLVLWLLPSVIFPDFYRCPKTTTTFECKQSTFLWQETKWRWMFANKTKFNNCCRSVVMLDPSSVLFQLIFGFFGNYVVGTTNL